MANRVELTESRIVIESVYGGAEREGGFYLVSTGWVCTRKKRRFFFSKDREIPTGFSLCFSKVAPVAIKSNRLDLALSSPEAHDIMTGCMPYY
jgi:hypothetical protein